MSELESPRSSIHTFISPPSSPPPADMEPTMEKIGLERPLPIVHNAKYYIEDEMSVFLVENQLFKVHRHFLRESLDFMRMFTQCPPRQDGPDGLSDQRPIPLPGVLSREFEALLDFFYRGMKCGCSKSLPSDLWSLKVELQRQIDLLSISTRYDFERVREAAINCIQYGLHRRDWRGAQWLAGISPVDRICLAEKYNIPQWLTPSYEDLCQRVFPLEVSEAEKIGVRTATLLARAREAVREQHSSQPYDSRVYRSRTPSPIPVELRYDAPMVTRIVREVFYPEISPSDSNIPSPLWGHHANV